MGASQSRRVHVFQDLADKTGFSIEQIRNLHDRFMYLTQEENILRREHLDNISYLAFNPIRRQIIEVFFDKRNLGQNEAGSLQEIGFEEFLTVLAFFRPPKPHATEEEIENIKRAKLRFLFNMHDTDNDGIITLDEYRLVVEKLLSSYETLDTENAKVISDAAMLEVASVTMGQMGPDEFYDGISFEHFLQILKGIEIETKMHIRFLNMNTTTMHFFNRE
ncbi:calcineurin B homologous protein 3-like isoform X1 [Myxocyprinus asiaticus]|uniref:calcineurin B homologous protein 3-like isoform X1 n=1 Tax=Myxocyprinus asiaticus TaxID=70543 RepID=UPI002222544C|nr:calcineurin B homologous protein 3-like isoform X1 [Myxocyprinus asiaticus]